MGYCTQYEIAAYDAATREPVERELEYEMTYRLEEISSGYAVREEFERWGRVDFDLWAEEPMKWYSHKEDMIVLSKEYPDYIFIVDGVGEEFPDAWRMWVKNGIAEKVYAEIKYPRPENLEFFGYIF